MSSDYVSKLKTAIITFLADALQSYIFTVYVQNNDMYAQQAISRKRWGGEIWLSSFCS